MSRHILPTASTMVGVCMTVIGLIKLMPGGGGTTRIDEILALDSLIFVTSAFFSYLSIRSSLKEATYERWADNTFMAALAVMALTTCVFALELL
ncbi:MAG TPA: hypothetical protein PKW44_06860 [Methylophilaceae bacterium]|nr:hypothetical protein [Methylophilaceae bacterium]HQR61373.1 hypothetical protein [Methylophilaceae bacterium]